MYLRDQERYLGKAVFKLSCCYDSVDIRDKHGKKVYNITSSFYACMLCEYVYFVIKPYKHRKKEGFGF